MIKFRLLAASAAVVVAAPSMAATITINAGNVNGTYQSAFNGPAIFTAVTASDTPDTTQPGYNIYALTSLSVQYPVPGGNSYTFGPQGISFYTSQTNTGLAGFATGPTANLFSFDKVSGDIVYGTSGSFTANGIAVSFAGGSGLNATITASVPEPATWGMMMMGFGAMGYAMRRKNAVARIRFA